MQRRLALANHATIVFDVQPSVLADIAEVCGDGGHPSPAAGDLDHHLRCPPSHRRFDSTANDSGLAADRSGSQSQGWRDLDYAAGRVEQTLAPLHEHAVKSGRRIHGLLLVLSSGLTLAIEPRRLAGRSADNVAEAKVR